MTPPRPPLLALALGLVVLTLAPGSPAGAHEGEGVLVVESASPTATGREYVVRLTWEDDGHAAVDATITATPVDPTGAPGTPVPMATVDQDGRYQAEVALPESGLWTVRFTSVTPQALVEVQETVAPAASSTTVEAPATTLAPSTTAASETTDTTAAEADDAGDDDEGGGAGWLIGAVVAAAVLAAGAYVFIRSGRDSGAP